VHLPCQSRASTPNKTVNSRGFVASRDLHPSGIRQRQEEVLRRALKTWPRVTILSPRPP